MKHYYILYNVYFFEFACSKGKLISNFSNFES